MKHFIQSLSVGFVAVSVVYSILYIICQLINNFSDILGWIGLVIVSVVCLYLLGDAILFQIKGE